MTLRAVVVGSGWAAHAARVFSERVECQLLAVSARGSERSRALASSLAVPLHSDLDETLALAPNLAAVSVDERENALIVERLLAAGCDVLCSHPVAPDVAVVQRLQELARVHGRVLSTDYSFRCRDEFIALRQALVSAGVLLRVTVEYPGRGLPMALDLVLGVAGPVRRVYASNSYPPTLKARRARVPQAFPPTLVLEHEAGCSSTLVPIPHSIPHAAYRIVASGERARLEALLPTGGLRRTTFLSTGTARVEQLVSEDARCDDPKIVYGDAMRQLVNAFVDAVVKRSAPPCPLEDEVAVRAVWAAITRSCREGQAVSLW